jgi:hypothetical protein
MPTINVALVIENRPFIIPAGAKLLNTLSTATLTSAALLAALCATTIISGYFAP